MYSSWQYPEQAGCALSVVVKSGFRYCMVAMDAMNLAKTIITTNMTTMAIDPFISGVIHPPGQ